jgi:hypothetical protein
MRRIKLLILLAPIFFISNRALAQQYPGYTLYANMNGSSAFLADTNGTTYKSWTGLSGNTCYSSYMLTGGVLLRTVKATGVSFTGGPIGGKIQKVNWNGTLLWDYTYSTSNYVTHHDICAMPNGNVLAIAYERKSAAEVAAAGCSTFSNEMWPDKIVEIMPTGATTGTVVWEWKAWDHLMQNTNPSAANYQASLVDHPELFNINYLAQKDWMHMNGLDYNDSLDQITFSCHNLHEVYIIDHSTTTAEAASHTGGNSGKGGDIIYRWGNPQAYGAAGAKILDVVHDAHWIPKGSPNAGRLACFNNRGQASPLRSTVDQIDLPYNGYNYSITPGAAFSPASYTSRIVATSYTSNMGSSNQLPNGNTLITVATSGLMYEVNAAGTILWSKTATGSVPQSHRYSECFILGAPATPTVTQMGDSLLASIASQYQWYYAGSLIPGAVSQIYQPTQNGLYQVIVSNSTGCESDTSLSFNFISTGIFSNSSSSQPTIFPNPSNGQLTVDLAAFQNQDFLVSIYDARGSLVFEASNEKQLDLSKLDNGLYTVVLRTDNNKIISKRLILAK